MSNYFKFVLVGPPKSGKTTFLKNLKGNNPSPRDYEPTVGLHHERHNKSINNTEHTLMLWDIGANFFSKLFDSHIPSAHVIFVFSRLDSSVALDNIAHDFKPDGLRQKNPKAKIILIGTYNRQYPCIIDDNEFDEFAKTFDTHFKLNLSDQQAIDSILTFSLTKAIEMQQEEQNALAQKQAYERQQLQNQQLTLATQKTQLAEKVETYLHQRGRELFNSLIAYIAYFLKLTQFFGHSTKQDKLTAARALQAALRNQPDNFNKLTPRQLAALNNGRLHSLYKQAKPLLANSQPNPSQDEHADQPTAREFNNFN